jgi:hypothetical protein
MTRNQRTKKLTSKGWSNEAPGTHERTVMQKECGSKCFLGPVGESCFPICTKNSCTINEKGVYAAYVRAREYGSPNMRRRSSTNKRKKHKLYGHNHSKKLYNKIANKAKTMLKKRGYGPNLK